MILLTHVSCSTSLFSATLTLMAAMTAGYSFLVGFVHLGKRSASMERKSGTSCATNLERFMSRSVRYTRISSFSVRFSRLVPPQVRSTERMLRRPKS